MKKKDYYKQVRVGKFWSKKYIKYESNGDRNRTLSVETYLNKLRTYLNSLKKSDTWKTQLTTAIKFISAKDDDDDEECVMHSKSDNIEIMINNKTLLSRNQSRLETSMKSSVFIFECVQLLYYKCY